MRARLIVVAFALNVSVTASAGVPAPVLLWSNGGCLPAYCQNAWYSSPAVYDIDGDGIADVIAASYDAVVLDATTGATKHRAASPNRVWGDVAIADLAGDGHPSAILARFDGNVFVYDGALSARAGWPVKPFASGEVRALAVANLDGNGKLQVIAGVASGVSTGQVDVYESNGAHRSGWPRLQSGEGYGYGIYNDDIGAADLTHAGHDEVIVGSDSSFLMGLNPDGSGIPAAKSFGSNLLWAQVHAWVDPANEISGFADCSTPVLNAWFTSSAPAIGDIDGDGTPEVAIVGNVVDCSTFTDQYYLPWLLRADRSRFVGSGSDWTTLPAPVAGSAPLSEANSVINDAMPNTVLADLDGNGKLEILYASYDGKVHAYWLDKTEHGSWPFAIPGGGIHFASPPVVADLYHDGNVEVLFTTWPEFATSETGKLYMLDHTGTVMASVDLPAPTGGGWNGGLASPTLAFLPGNRDINVIVSTWATGVVAYRLPGTAYGRTRWPTGRGSYRRNGVAFNDRIYADGAGG
jgi:hypothetical protein